MSLEYQRICIVEKFINPSTDNYIVPFLKHVGASYERVSWRNLDFDHKVDLVFIVRYLSPKVLKWLSRVKPRRIFYFMDDDLLDFSALKDLPVRYAFKLFTQAYVYKRWIQSNTTILVSNENLQRKYKGSLLLPPNPVWLWDTEIRYTGNYNRSPFVVFYHATASHREEFFWLAELINRLQNKDVFFEVVVDKNLARVFKGLKNVWLINPMDWHTYLNFLRLPYRNLALSINFPNSFNLMRTNIKFFNNLYAGVVGIYNTHFPKSEDIKKYNAGFVLDLDLDVWIEKMYEIKANFFIVEQIFKNAVSLYKIYFSEVNEKYKRLSQDIKLSY